MRPSRQNSQSGRSAILAKVRQNVTEKDEAIRRRNVEGRLRETPVGLIPARGRKAPAERVNLFCALAEKVQASVTRISDLEELPKNIATYLRDRNLSPTLKMGRDARFSTLKWAGRNKIEVTIGAAEPSDQVSLSYALGGVAETGTLMLESGVDNPTSLNFLPETHIVVVNASEIVGDYETLWARIRNKYGAGKLPRTINMITGPSRSGDIEQKILLGAHGPRTLQIFLVED